MNHPVKIQSPRAHLIPRTAIRRFAIQALFGVSLLGASIPVLADECHMKSGTYWVVGQNPRWGLHIEEAGYGTISVTMLSGTQDPREAVYHFDGLTDKGVLTSQNKLGLPCSWLAFIAGQGRVSGMRFYGKLIQLSDGNLYFENLAASNQDRKFVWTSR